MSIHIHVGYPKTASTWIQKKFLPYVQNIKIYDREFIKNCFLDSGAFDFNPMEIKSLFETDEKINCWLSEERLLGGLRSGGVKGFITKEVANRLKEVFPNGIIIIFIRNQIDILASAYLQYVKSGGNYGINKFLFSKKYFRIGANDLILFNPEFFLYDKVIKHYHNLFGKENVNIFLYEEFDENPEKFVASFAEKFNLNYSFNDIDFSRTNTGYSKFLIFTKRVSNTFTRVGPLNKYYIINIPKLFQVSRFIHDYANQYKIFGKRADSLKIIGEKNYEYFVNYYKSSNKTLINEFGLNQIINYSYPL